MNVKSCELDSWTHIYSCGGVNAETSLCIAGRSDKCHVGQPFSQSTSNLANSNHNPFGRSIHILDNRPERMIL